MGFPTPTGSCFFKDAADKFGQSFLCVTLKSDAINKLAKAMLINRPSVYYTKKVSDDATSRWAVDEAWDDSDTSAVIEVTSRGNTKFTVFAKSGKFGKDLWEGLVASKTGSLEVEAWRNGAGKMGPACGSNEVLNVQDVKFPGLAWKVTQDHSKWAVTEKGTWVCVGDINRATPQKKRGGGAWCTHDSAMHKALHDAIVDADKCKDDKAALIV